tara:strand:+ start:1391 stop:1567 length:177 start_codon:yes stop_codon:yes gene_type:complete
MSIDNPYNELRREKINGILNTIIKVLVIMLIICAIIALVPDMIDTFNPPQKEGKILKN